MLLILPFGIGSSIAQDQSDEAVDPVSMFNELCYTKVPSIKAINDMATRFAWEPMGGEDLKQFTTIQNPEVLLGWDVRFSERLFRLGVVQSKLGAEIESRFPGFSGGDATSCMIVLDGQDSGQSVLDGMNQLAGKEPYEKNVLKDGLFGTSWAGGNEVFKVFLVVKTDQQKQANLISVSILAKQQ
ncbi:MAG: hypothetical protein AAF217_06800 [Pseudomonadota bacterium]